MAEAERQKDVGFEQDIFSDVSDYNSSPEFSLEEDNESEEPEFSLEDSDDIENDELLITESDDSDDEEEVSLESQSDHNKSTSDYSDDILSASPKAAPSREKESIKAQQEDSNDIEEFEYTADIDIHHSPGLLHSQQAHQLEMSLLERIDDLIQVLEKRAKGNTPEQLPHKQFATGIHYIKHEKNHYLGAKWLRKAAMQGHAKAQLYLGMLFVQGNGVPKSLFHAYAWFSLAVCQNIDEAVDARKKLERHLTAKDINAALKYAADILDKIHSPL